MENNNELNNVQDNFKNENFINKKKERKLLIILFIIFTLLGCNSFFIYINTIPVAQAAKPIIYLYPEQELKLNVSLAYPEKLSCSYPKYNPNSGWNIIANPNGTLIETDSNKKLYSLYWEGENYNSKMQEEGFIIKGEDVAEFLEEKLTILGLNYKESEEFIIYWLPKLQKNKFNYIRFASMDEINEYMPLTISTTPDSLIRVFMEFKALNSYIEIPEQHLETPSRKGFVVVEWGGSEIK